MKYVNTANCQFGNVELWHCYQVAWVAIREQVASALESAVYVGLAEVHLFPWVSSVSADSWRCHIGKKDIHPGGFDEGLPGVFPSQALTLYSQETQLPVSSLPRLQHKVPLSHIAFPLFRSAITLLWPILVIFKARHMSDCCSLTRPPCLAIVADMLKTYKKLIAASINMIRLVPQRYTPL